MSFQPINQQTEVSDTSGHQFEPQNAPKARVSRAARIYARFKARCDALGLCQRCSKPRVGAGGEPSGRSAVPKTLCEECRQAQREKIKQDNARRKAAGLCACGQPARPGFLGCSACAASIGMKSKTKRDRWRASGLCTNCGGHRSDPNLMWCLKCRTNDQSARVRRRFQRAREEARENVLQSQVVAMPAPPSVLPMQTEEGRPAAEDGVRAMSGGSHRGSKRVSINSMLN